MTKEKLTRLTQILNTLCLISVKGENAIYMGRSLEALQDFIKIEEEEMKQQNVEPTAAE